MAEGQKRRRVEIEEKQTTSPCAASVYVFSSKRQMSEAAAAYVHELTTSCSPRILFPAGTTPLGSEGFFAALQRHAAQGMNAAAIRLVSGDEYYGVSQADPGCFTQYLTKEVIRPLGLDTSKAMMLDGGVVEEGVTQECAEYELSLRLDPLDLAVLGLGTNGHVAFNDPPCAADSITRKLILTEVSVNTAQSDFPQRAFDDLPRHALSVGLSTLAECAAQCVVMAPGANKADIVQQALEGDYVGPLVPASQLRGCPNFAFFLDTASASKLKHVKPIVVPEGSPLFFPVRVVDRQPRKAVLCADIGGTNGRVRVYLLSLNQDQGQQVDSSPWFERVYRMAEFRSYSQLALRCMADIEQACYVRGDSARNVCMRESCARLIPQLVSGCWAVCGPVWNDGEMNDPNNLWPGQFQKASELASIFQLPRGAMRFVNDFESIGHSIAALCGGGAGSERCKPQLLKTLYAGDVKGPPGVVGCMGAGTGLGLVFLTRGTNGEYTVFPSEGGMIDSFSPRTELEWGLKKYLMQLHGEYIEVERVVSGPGLVDVYRFLCAADSAALQALNVIEPDLQPQHVSLLAQEAFVAGRQSAALASLDLFLTVYGRALGGACVTLMPYEGIYIAGGILSKLLWRLEAQNPLLTAYLDLGPKMSMISRNVPLILIMDETVGLSGALKVSLDLRRLSQDGLDK